MAVQFMNMRRVANDIGQVWGYDDFGDVPGFGQDRIRIDINQAIQLMQSCGEDFYGREDLVLDLTTGSGSYELPQNVQSVLEPVRLQDGSLLRKLTTESQVWQYGALFRETLNPTVATGKPEAYYVRSTKSDDQDDSVKSVIMLLPAPSADFLTNKPVIPVIKEAGLFTTAQLTSGTSSLPVPHKYVESIFLPLARYNATTCTLFYNKDNMPKYQEDYDRALEVLGISDPRQRPKHPESNSNAIARKQQTPQQQQ